MKKVFLFLTFFGISLIVYSQENTTKVVKIKSSEANMFQFSEYPTKVVIIDNANAERAKINNATIHKQKRSSTSKGVRNNKSFTTPNLTRITTKE